VGRLARRGRPHEGRGAALVLHDAHHLPEALGRHRGAARAARLSRARAGRREARGQRVAVVSRRRRAKDPRFPTERVELRRRGLPGRERGRRVAHQAHEGKTLKEIIALPPSALQGVAAHADDAWAALGVKSIGDLGSWKFAAAAHAIATLAACEASDASQHK